MVRTIHILHTNDFHNNLKPREAEQIGRMRSSLGKNTLLLDAGDAISAGNVGVRLTGEPILATMSELGYDAMAMGNREFHIAENCLRVKINRAQFPVLCANMRRKQKRRAPMPVQANIVKTLPNGVRVGVFGLTVPMVTERMAARVLSSFLFDDPVVAAHAQIAVLRPKVDVLIALTHIGLREDKRLAAACPEVDLIVGGHSHVVLSEAKREYGAPIVQAGWFAHYAGITRIAAPEVGRAQVVTSSLLTLGDGQGRR